MRSSVFRLHVYTVIVAFIVLWALSVRITIKSTQNDPYYIADGDKAVVTASEMLLKRDDPKIIRIGEIGWGIVFFGFSGGVLLAAVNFRDAVNRRRLTISVSDKSNGEARTETGARYDLDGGAKQKSYTVNSIFCTTKTSHKRTNVKIVRR